MSNQILSQESGGLPKTIEVQAAAMRGDPRKVKAQAKINDELITLMAANSAISAIKREENYLASLLEGDRGGTLKDRKPKELENAIIASNMQKLQPKIDQAMGIAAQNKRKSDKNIQQVAMGRNQSTGIMPRPVKTKMAQGGIARFQGLSGSQVKDPNAITDDELKEIGLTREEHNAMSEEDQLENLKKAMKTNTIQTPSVERTSPQQRKQAQRKINPQQGVIDLLGNIRDFGEEAQTKGEERNRRRDEIKFRKKLTDAGVSQEAIEEAVASKFSAGIPAAGVDTNTATTTTTASAPTGLSPYIARSTGPATNTARPNFSTIAPTDLSPYIARDPMITQEMITGTGTGSATPSSTGTGTNTGTGIPDNASLAATLQEQLTKQAEDPFANVPKDLATQSVDSVALASLRQDMSADPMSAFNLSDARLKEMGTTREDYDKLGITEQRELFYGRKDQAKQRAKNLERLEEITQDQTTGDKSKLRERLALFAPYSELARAYQGQMNREEQGKYNRLKEVINLSDSNLKNDFAIAQQVGVDVGNVYQQIAGAKTSALAALASLGEVDAKLASDRAATIVAQNADTVGATLKQMEINALNSIREAANSNDKLNILTKGLKDLLAAKTTAQNEFTAGQSPVVQKIIDKANEEGVESLSTPQRKTYAEYLLGFESQLGPNGEALEKALVELLRELYPDFKGVSTQSGGVGGASGASGTGTGVGNFIDD